MHSPYGGFKDTAVDLKGRTYWARTDKDTGEAYLVCYEGAGGQKCIWGRVVDGEPNAHVARIISAAKVS
jgi:hypothetical protein